MMHVFLTGVTGFLGKVVLEELLSRRQELNLSRVTLLIRENKKRGDPWTRFQKEVRPSQCFSKLPEDWTEFVQVISGELKIPGFGLEREEETALANQITHIVNCAASVEFDLPIKEAAEANILTSLNVLEFAKRCPKLKSLVNISTAYVTPHTSHETPIAETLVPLPKPAKEIYAAILEEKVKADDLLKETGHPNTYTFVKCLAEHLLIENKGPVPLTLIRPSILCASLQHPFEGWIDSPMAFAAFVIMIGLGYLRAVIGNNETRLDLIPCDFVAGKIIEAFSTKPLIQHVVAGKENACPIHLCIQAITDFFRRHPVAKTPFMKYVGPENFQFLFRDLQYRTIPLNTLGSLCRLTGSFEKAKKIFRLKKQIAYLNEGFHYFMNNSFNFVTQNHLPSSFQKEKYIEITCQGVYRHLLRKDKTQVVFGGKRLKSNGSDWIWAFTKRQGNPSIQWTAFLLKKGLRKCLDQVTFDRLALEQALAQVPKEDLLVIVPTHRSYMDFILCSYLFFAHPELGIPVPFIAAAEEFSRIPFLGKFFQKMQAFYVQRGLGKENPDLTSKIFDFVSSRKTLEFFIEGKRSRSRQILNPKTGILKCLKATGKTFSILPIIIDYDRIPEESAMIHELKGNPKPPMRLKPLLSWMRQLLKGEIELGRIHLSFGEPLRLTPFDDVHKIGISVLAEFQKHLTTSTFHLKCFLKNNSIEGIDLDWLKKALIQRGGKVLESSLEVAGPVEDIVERTLRHQWIHHFYPEALTVYADNEKIRSSIEQNLFAPLTRTCHEENFKDPRIKNLVRVLFDLGEEDPIAYEKPSLSGHRSQWFSGTPFDPNTSQKPF